MPGQASKGCTEETERACRVASVSVTVLGNGSSLSSHAVPRNGSSCSQACVEEQAIDGKSALHARRVSRISVPAPRSGSYLSSHVVQRFGSHALPRISSSCSHASADELATHGKPAKPAKKLGADLRTRSALEHELSMHSPKAAVRDVARAASEQRLRAQGAVRDLLGCGSRVNSHARLLVRALCSYVCMHVCMYVCMCMYSLYA
jgi:hypothetical protein